MMGQIKFIDLRGGYGYIATETDDGNKADVHFWVDDFVVDNPPLQCEGFDVEYELGEGRPGKPHAKLVWIAGTPRPLIEEVEESDASSALFQWAYIPFKSGSDEFGNTFPSALDELTGMALPEKWFFGEEPPPSRPYPILANYLRYTFYKLKIDGKVVENRDWATFNTGLVDELFDPIYALFQRNDRETPPWKFSAFCVPGKGPAGKQLTSIFAPLPPPAHYFSSMHDMLLDTSQEIHVDYEHVILDGVERDRFPFEFLVQFSPRGFDLIDYRKLPSPEREEYLKRLRGAIDNDLRCTRMIKNRLEDAKVLAEKRTRWNFKTAIPQYYPRLNIMSLLLPLALVDDEKVDISLVVTRNPSGSYQGRTVLPLNLAYMNARLVCRPDSDWLTTDSVYTERYNSEDTEVTAE